MDNGTNLIALSKAMFRVQDLNGELSDRLNMEVRVTNAKSHEENGRVEVRIRELRRIVELLGQLREQDLGSQTILQWETIFGDIANALNNLPIATSNNSRSRSSELKIITPNRLLLGRNQYRAIAAPMITPEFTGPQNMLQNNERISKAWYTLYMKNLHRLMPQVSKFGKTEPVAVGDVVMFVTEEGNLAGSGWKLGRVSKIVSLNSIEIEYAVVNARSKEINRKTVMRSPRQCSRILGANECRTNTSEVFETAQ